MTPEQPGGPGAKFPGSPVFAGLVADDGRTWDDFRHTLRPHYAHAWRDVAICHVMLVLGLVAQATAAGQGLAVSLLALPLTAAWMGFWTAALMLFVHEAAHYQMHPRKASNDRLSNWLVGAFVAEDIADYRATHWLHHLYLGTPDDTEVSYRNAPTPGFLVSLLTGVHVLRTVAARSRRPSGDAAPRPGKRRGPLRFAAYQAAVLAVAMILGRPSMAVAWLASAVVVYPFLGALRQMLEHRAIDARADFDYAVVQHGAVNRMFGTDLVSRLIGSAGFNRHLLHHWYPWTSYTRFDDLEAFFMRTPLASQIDAARTTYWSTFRALAAAARA